MRKTKEELLKEGWFEFQGNLIKYSPPTEKFNWESLQFIPLSSNKDAAYDLDPESISHEVGEVDERALETRFEYDILMALAKHIARG